MGHGRESVGTEKEEKEEENGESINLDNAWYCMMYRSNSQLTD